MPVKRISAYLILLLLAALFLFRQCGSHDWAVHYLPESKDPYGLFLIRKALEGYFEGKAFQVISDSLPVREGGGIFVSIDGYFQADSARQGQLLRFVRSGNQAFIACEEFPSSLLDSMMQGGVAGAAAPPPAGPGLEVPWQSEAALNFTHPALRLDSSYVCRHRSKTDTFPSEWRYFPDVLLEAFPPGLVRIGSIHGDKANCISLPYGKGRFFLHSTPMAFTNINLVEGGGLQYAGRLFSHLEPGDIYWEDFKWSMPAGQPGFPAEETPLKYVLSKPSLAWAWYILLGMAVVYLFFRAKRRQRVIPVLEQNVNGSLEFIGTIGRLSFLQNNHRRLSRQEMKLFLSFVRDKYRLSTRELDEDFISTLAARSEVPEALIRSIVLLDRNIKTSGFVSDAILVDFHNMLEEFRRTCR